MAFGVLESAISISLIPLISAYGFITLYQRKKINKNKQMRLQHLNPYEQQNYIISNATEIINKYNSIPTNYVVDYRGKEIVQPYMEQLVNSLGNDIRLAKKNFSTLRVEHSKKLDITGAVGTYNGSENVIKYVKNTASILGHEMLHMASYMYNEQTDTHHHGFMQQKGEAKIGFGLNEGYTELLASRMFNNGKVSGYPRLVRIVKLLEDFFPNPQTVSHYYFTCNLPAFIHNLERYCTRTEINEILFGLDELYDYEYTMSNPLAAIKETQLATKIYSIYERNFATEQTRVKSFQTKASENKLTALAISGKKFSLQRNNPFRRIKTGIQNGFRKVKNFFTGNATPTPQPAYTR